jgi:hypothetical protein
LGPYRIGDEVRLKCTAYGGMYYILRKKLNSFYKDFKLYSLFFLIYISVCSILEFIQRWVKVN